MHALSLTFTLVKEFEGMANVLPVNCVKWWEEQGTVKNWLKCPGLFLFPSPLLLGGSVERKGNCVMAFLPITV